MKRVFTLFLTIIMAFCMTIPAFAEEPETALGQKPTEVSSVNEISPHVPPTFERLSLSTDSWTYLYDDNNFLNEYVYIDNLEGNPGGIYVHIEAKTSSGSIEIIEKGKLVPVGGRYTSPKIENTYVRYVVTLKAASRNGTYRIQYSDWF